MIFRSSAGATRHRSPSHSREQGAGFGVYADDGTDAFAQVLVGEGDGMAGFELRQVRCSRPQRPGASVPLR
jgi:hypothetical protein